MNEELQFEWDDNKNEYNKRVHHLSFETAALVFADKNRVEFVDTKHSTPDETRYITIGKVNKVLYVSFTERGSDGVIRLISARIATSAERRIYGDY